MKEARPDTQPVDAEQKAPATSPVGGSAHSPEQAKTPAEVQAPPSGKAQSNPDAHERARRRARVIVSDLTLYEKNTLVEAARAPDSKKALGVLWLDAVRSYDEAVPPEIRASTNYLEEELGKCLAQLRGS